MRSRRPLLLRFLPPRLRGSVWSRHYRPTAHRFHGLFSDARLYFAPTVSMRLHPGDVISDSIAFTGIYELPFSRVLFRLAREGGHMVDVGANLGYFSLLWAAANDRNTVTAFEASALNLDLLQHNVSRNRMGDRVEARSQAVGQANGDMEFDPGPDDQTGWGSLALARTERSQRVSVVRLDDALDGVDQIELLKIDIEGADTWALLGAENMLRENRIKHIWWEQNRPRMRELGISEMQAADFLRDFGYQPVPVGNPKADIVNWHGTRRLEGAGKRLVF